MEAVLPVGGVACLGAVIGVYMLVRACVHASPAFAGVCALAACERSVRMRAWVWPCLLPCNGWCMST